MRAVPRTAAADRAGIGRRKAGVRMKFCSENSVDSAADANAVGVLPQTIIRTRRKSRKALTHAWGGAIVGSDDPLHADCLNSAAGFLVYGGTSLDGRARAGRDCRVPGT